MKAKKENISVKELFKQKLDYEEIIPDASVYTKLMHKLAVREFLHFNPSSFNVYYLGGVLFAGITIALILNSVTGKSDKLPDMNIQKELHDTIGVINASAPIKQNDIQKSESLTVNAIESVNNKESARPKTETLKEYGPKKTSLGSDITISRPDANTLLKQKGLFTGSATNNDKLQSKFKSEQLIFESSVGEGCAPLKVLFHNNIAEYDSCKWTFGDGGSSGKGDTEWIYDVEGDYKVVLEVFGANGLKTTSDKIINVHPKPLARFEISPEKTVLPDDEIRFLNYSTDAVRYKWNFGDGSSSELFEPTHRYEKFGHFNVGLVVYSEYGCSDSIVVLNAFSDSEYFIEFPNAFIPSTGGPSGGFYSSKSDETAQIFHPSFSGVSDYQLKIFSKSGLLIFESNDINIGWDGYFNGQICNTGVYIWKVRGNFRNGETFTRLGDVTILRNGH